MNTTIMSGTDKVQRLVQQYNLLSLTHCWIFPNNVNPMTPRQMIHKRMCTTEGVARDHERS